MNKWVQKSIQIANSPGYLDKLYEVYPYTPEGERKIPVEVQQELKKNYNEQNKIELVKILMKLEKFPIDDPYIGFLRKERGIFLEYNPQTVSRIAERVLSIGFEKMMEGIKEPKKVSRQSGSLFRRWVSNLDFPILPEGRFKTYKGIAILDGTNGQLRDFANNELRCNLGKKPDFLAKAGENYIVGEAKFLTAGGGGQDRGFDDAIILLMGTDGNAIRIAILDGVAWIKNSTRMYRTICQLEKVALSALLLKDFLEDLPVKKLRFHNCETFEE